MVESEPTPIVDFHCHVASEMCFPRSFQDGVVDNVTLALASKGIPIPREKVARAQAGTLQDPLCDQLVKEMDDAGIGEAVLLLPDFTWALRDSTHTIEELVAHHGVVQERHPGRFHVFVGVDPRWGDDGIALFEGEVRAGRCAGLKAYPPCGYTLADKALYPFYEVCAEYGLPVLSHIGATSPVLDFELAQPIHVDRAARDFPGVDFVLAHGSVHYPDECAMLCTNRPNVYLDVSGYETMAMTGLQQLFRRGITHKVLFGTDWPIFRLQGHQADFVARLEAEGAFPDTMTAADRALFFHGNARRLLDKRTRKASA
ncbi:MAG TPA: amidohydrolase family protein [Acidimicrobiales bacterium]|nr:amidohydrolase family protein [Acidimicrobiales bacterium]